MGNSGLDGAISPTGVAFLEGEGAISPDTAKNPTPYSLWHWQARPRGDSEGFCFELGCLAAAPRGPP